MNDVNNHKKKQIISEIKKKTGKTLAQIYKRPIPIDLKQATEIYNTNLNYAPLITTIKSQNYHILVIYANLVYHITPALEIKRVHGVKKAPPQTKMSLIMCEYQNSKFYGMYFILEKGIESDKNPHEQQAEFRKLKSTVKVLDSYKSVKLGLNKFMYTKDKVYIVTHTPNIYIKNGNKMQKWSFGKGTPKKVNVTGIAVPNNNKFMNQAGKIKNVSPNANININKPVLALRLFDGTEDDWEKFRTQYYQKKGGNNGYYIMDPKKGIFLFKRASNTTLIILSKPSKLFGYSIRNIEKESEFKGKIKNSAMWTPIYYTSNIEEYEFKKASLEKKLKNKAIINKNTIKLELGALKKPDKEEIHIIDDSKDTVAHILIQKQGWSYPLTNLIKNNFVIGAKEMNQIEVKHNKVTYSRATSTKEIYRIMQNIELAYNQDGVWSTPVFQARKAIWDVKTQGKSELMLQFAIYSHKNPHVSLEQIAKILTRQVPDKKVPDDIIAKSLKVYYKFINGKWVLKKSAAKAESEILGKLKNALDFYLSVSKNKQNTSIRDLVVKYILSLNLKIKSDDVLKKIDTRYSDFMSKKGGKLCKQQPSKTIKLVMFIQIMKDDYKHTVNPNTFGLSKKIIKDCEIIDTVILNNNSGSPVKFNYQSPSLTSFSYLYETDHHGYSKPGKTILRLVQIKKGSFPIAVLWNYLEKIINKNSTIPFDKRITRAFVDHGLDTQDLAEKFHKEHKSDYSSKFLGYSKDYDKKIWDYINGTVELDLIDKLIQTHYYKSLMFNGSGKDVIESAGKIMRLYNLGTYFEPGQLFHFLKKGYKKRLSCITYKNQVAIEKGCGKTSSHTNAIGVNVDDIHHRIYYTNGTINVLSKEDILPQIKETMDLLTNHLKKILHTGSLGLGMKNVDEHPFSKGKLITKSVIGIVKYPIVFDNTTIRQFAKKHGGKLESQKELKTVTLEDDNTKTIFYSNGQVHMSAPPNEIEAKSKQAFDILQESSDLYKVLTNKNKKILLNVVNNKAVVLPPINANTSKFNVIEVCHQGGCFYNAIALAHYMLKKPINNAVKQSSKLGIELRKKLSKVNLPFNKYYNAKFVKKALNTNLWGDTSELVHIANLLKTSIHLYSNGKVERFSIPGAPTIHILHHSGNRFDVLVPASPNSNNVPLAKIKPKKKAPKPNSNNVPLSKIKPKKKAPKPNSNNVPKKDSKSNSNNVPLSKLCKTLKKTKDPKCESVKGCKWVVKSGCLPK